MRRSIGNTLAVAGLSAMSMIGGPACGGESGGPEREPIGPIEQTTTTTTTTVFDGYEAAPLDDVYLRVIEIRDTSDSTAANADIRHAEIETTYPIAAEMYHRSTLGQASLILSETIVVDLPHNASEEVCVSRFADDPETGDSNWNNAMQNVRDEAFLLAAAQTPLPAEFTTTVYNFDFDVCHIDNRTLSDGSQFTVAGTGGTDGDIDMFFPNPRTVDHEIAHTRGAGHNGDLICSPLQTLTVAEFSIANCTLREYGGGGSIMGASNEYDRDSFNSYEMLRQGILNPGQIIDVTKSGIYRLDALLNEGTGPRAIRIAVDDDKWFPDLVERSKGLNPTQYYAADPQEYVQFELSGEDHLWTDETYCPSLSPLDLQRSAECNRQDVDVKGYRVGDYRETANEYPFSLRLPDTRREPGVLFDHNGVLVEVIDVNQGEVGDARGTAVLRVTMPEDR